MSKLHSDTSESSETVEAHESASEVIATDASLRALYGEPSALARDKVLKQLDKHCRQFIALSPFAVLATTSRNGEVDASPRGDAPGFVQCEGNTVILLPDRRGNNRTDSFENLIDNPGVGLLFFIPGVNETLRVNGQAKIQTESSLLARFAVRDKQPRSVLRISIDEAFLHCAKALVRSKLWEEAYRVDRKTLPTLGAMLADQIEGVDATESDAAIEESLKHRLY